MNKTFVVIVVIAVVALIGYWLFGKNEQPIISQPITERIPSTEEKVTEEKIVIYSDVGYSPNTLTIKNGEIVIFKNQSAKTMWPASAMHPSHRVYSGTSLDEHCPDTADIAFDACQGFLPDETWSFRFDKIGEWKYHDHLNPGDFGTIVVR